MLSLLNALMRVLEEFFSAFYFDWLDDEPSEEDEEEE